MKKNTIHNVDEYINSFSGIQLKQLKKMRSLVKKRAPQAQELISYQMPTYKQGKTLLHFAAYEKHIGFYPTPDGITAFKDQLTSYKTSKGAIQFPIDEALPEKLITDIVKYRLAIVV